MNAHRRLIGAVTWLRKPAPASSRVLLTGLNEVVDIHHLKMLQQPASQFGYSHADLARTRRSSPAFAGAIALAAKPLMKNSTPLRTSNRCRAIVIG